MLCTWQVRADAGSQAAPQRVVNSDGARAVLAICDQCQFLRVGYIRVMLPSTVTVWRLDLVFSESDDTQNVVLLADSTSALTVAEPRVGLTTTQWWADRVFPGRPATQRFDQGALRLFVSPLPVAEWSATIDLDIYTPNPPVEPCP